MSQTVVDVLSQAVFYTDDADYVVIRMPARAIVAAASVLAEVGEPFSTLIVDKDEVTLILDVEAYEEYKHRLRDSQADIGLWRLITLDMELESDLVGLMAVISQALANAGVSVLPIAAYSRDHILVPAQKIDTALTALNALKTANQ
ncbi:MAG: ACT domain-containing protein [Anaerolineae bacterium]|nr:ACT domain-containing protein [Anaerolineae bacterium]